MGFAEAARETDADKARGLFHDFLLADEKTGGENFFDTERERADEIPLLRGISEGADELLVTRLRTYGYTEDGIQGVLMGIDICRIAVACYAGSEAPDTPPLT